MDMEKKLELLNRQIAYARQHAPFYADLPEQPLKQVGDLKQIPSFGAETLVREGTKMLCCSPSRIRRVVSLESSGTSGKPKRVYFTENDLEQTIDFFHRGMKKLCGPYRRVGIFMPGNSPDGLSRLLTAGLERFGAVPLYYGMVEETEKAAGWCRENRPEVLVGIPSQIRRLALTARDLGIRRVLLSADNIAPVLADTIAACWNAEVYVHYGMTESGLGCAVQTPGLSYMWLRQDVLLEQEENGELLLTTLKREAMPLIRYRTGDKGVLDSHGNLLRVDGRLSELNKRVSILQLDRILYGMDEVLDYEAVLDGEALTVTVLGKKQEAEEALRVRLPEVKIRVLESGEPYLKMNGKRRVHEI